MRGRLVTAVCVLAVMAVACHRTDAPEKAEADYTPLCAEPATLSALMARLLPEAGAGRRYQARLKTAHVTLSEVRATGSSADMANCSATAVLVSPVVKDDPRATQHLSFGVRPGEGNRPELVDLQAADGGGVQPFVDLLSHPKLGAAPAPAPPVVEPAALETPVAPTEPRPARSFSEQTQSLIDQAGDTRTAPASDESSRTAPDAGALNSIAGTY